MFGPAIKGSPDSVLKPPSDLVHAYCGSKKAGFLYLKYICCTVVAFINAANNRVAQMPVSVESWTCVLLVFPVREVLRQQQGVACPSLSQYNSVTVDV